MPGNRRKSESFEGRGRVKALNALKSPTVASLPTPPATRRKSPSCRQRWQFWHIIVGCSECGFGTINSYERNCQVRSCGICRYCPLRGSSCRAVSAAVFAWGHALFSFEQLGQKTLVPIVILSAPASSLSASDVFHPATRFMLTASVAASVREAAPIFSRIFLMWSFTVSRETPAMSAISLFEKPLAIRFSISS